eukprot:3699022-Rhodomonas_salina.1
MASNLVRPAMKLLESFELSVRFSRTTNTARCASRGALRATHTTRSSVLCPALSAPASTSLSGWRCAGASEGGNAVPVVGGRELLALRRGRRATSEPGMREARQAVRVREGSARAWLRVRVPGMRVRGCVRIPAMR